MMENNKGIILKYTNKHLIYLAVIYLNQPSVNIFRYSLNKNNSINVPNDQNKYSY